MGVETSTYFCVDDLFRACRASDDETEILYTTEDKREVINEAKARRQSIKDSNKEQKQEINNLEMLSSSLKQTADKQTLYNQCSNPKSFKLLYRGSRKGFKLSSLHHSCDNISNIFVMIKSTDNNTFGFYSSKGFDSDNINSYIKDKEAFVFSIKQDKCEIFNIKPNYKNNALFNSDFHFIQIGGDFGCDADICIKANSHNSYKNITKGSLASDSLVYSHPNNGYLNDGKTEFFVKELLIYTVIVSYPNDNMSYAESDDYFEEKDAETDKFHIYVLETNKVPQFKCPKYRNDIDVNSVNYGGCVIGSDWNESLDITQTLNKLKIRRKDCTVLVFVENILNGNKLTQMNSNKINEIEFVKTPSASMAEKEEMSALRRKYTSRRLVLQGKDKMGNMPKCTACDAYLHIQNDPINAYDGVGIICDICNKNRNDNPELVLDEHYYKCENCESMDMCSQCYKKEKESLSNVK